ncbi:Transamidase GatB domain protein [Candidatus Phaeomarinobacter ectocarpi]|uniref:Transamidase GatB domain protein n=1 Tax=Candidatus Phaeomarinibacter ectocarpi TaxID=1458461 RepID=X5MKN1_9HYPH|nr:GatB/YqeY domain-containing protein [Candidatus Phaeomarinobacter ectocarpi]CDO58725.1 Transamidase GatB domain protein [Candidatus Phaeomarinobacter ectocarpi]
MRDTFKAALKDALKAGDKRRLATLRLITAAIKDRDINARSEGKDPVSDGEILQILAKMIKQRRESATTYEEAGRLELATQEREEIEIIEGFLPQQLGEDEVEAACKEVIAELGADGLKDMGKCMGVLKDKYAGQMDFAQASKSVKDLLS